MKTRRWLFGLLPAAAAAQRTIKRDSVENHPATQIIDSRDVVHNKPDNGECPVCHKINQGFAKAWMERVEHGGKVRAIVSCEWCGAVFTVFIGDRLGGKN
jgi:hypothetical protein